MLLLISDAIAEDIIGAIVFIIFISVLAWVITRD